MERLQNLVKTGQLKPHAPTAVELNRLLAAARRALQDSEHRGISRDSRFDAAYRAVMQCALLAMMTAGYRPSTNMPGHHQLLIACLRDTMSLENETVLLLDTLRRKRNLVDYQGDPIDDESMNACIGEAAYLLSKAEELLKP
jgi:hypothetical protein